jgi:hypothetical protein
MISNIVSIDPQPASIYLDHLFIHVIRVIPGLIVFWRERLNDLFEARSGSQIGSSCSAP